MSEPYGLWLLPNGEKVSVWMTTPDEIYLVRPRGTSVRMPREEFMATAKKFYPNKEEA